MCDCTVTLGGEDVYISPYGKHIYPDDIIIQYILKLKTSNSVIT